MCAKIYTILSMVLVSGISQVVSHACASYTSCKSKNVTNCNTIDSEVCPKPVKSCISSYMNDSGYLKPVHMGCWDTERIGHTCGSDSCPLELLNNFYTCCCHKSMCNRNATFVPLANTTSVTPVTKRSVPGTLASNNLMLVAYIVSPALVVLVAVFAHCLRKHKESVRQENDCLLELHEVNHIPTEYESLDILETLHEGHFAKVYKAQYMNEIVAVKSIKQAELELWTNERDIYEKWGITHQNILQFLRTEKRHHEGSIDLLIMTEYCTNGSLADYLCKNTLHVVNLIQMVISISKGLDYLHSNEQSSVVIAHRDLKSTNILMRADLTCCLADFGLSMAFPNNRVPDLSATFSQVGTRRYMAPEVLRGAMAYTAECFTAADIYSYALVAWELLSRTNTTDLYELPYSKEVGLNPTIESMINCVVVRSLRPLFKDEWRSDPVLNVICETIEECWDVDGSARVTARLVLQRFSKIQNSSVQNGGAGEKMSDFTRLNSKEVEFVDCIQSADSEVIISEQTV